MTIREAIRDAKEYGNWCEAYSEPTSVNVGFLTLEGKEDETQFDLYAADKESELISLWDTMYDEMESTRDGVTYVEALGYVE